MSVRLLRLADRGTGSAAHRGTDRAGYQRPGDGAGRGLLFDGLAAGGGTHDDKGKYKGDGDAVHDKILLVARLERDWRFAGSGTVPKVKIVNETITKTIERSAINPVCAS